MGDNEASRSTLDRIRDAKQAASPETGYRLAEWDMLKPPAEQIEQTSRSWLTLSEVSIPPESKFTEWSVFDRYTNDYVSQKFQQLPEEPDPESISQSIAAIKDGDNKTVRIELVRISRVAQQHPSACEPAVPALNNKIVGADIAVQAEILDIFTKLAIHNTELVVPALDTVDNFLSEENDDRIRERSVNLINTIADNERVTGPD